MPNKTDKIDLIHDQLKLLNNDELYALANHFMGLLTQEFESEKTEIGVLMHLVIIQDYLLKRLGFGEQRKLRTRQRRYPQESCNVKLTPAAAPKYGGPKPVHNQRLTHNPFAEALKKKD